MARWGRLALTALAALLLCTACGPQVQTSSSQEAALAREPTAKKRITAATTGTLIRANRIFASTSSDPPGTAEFEMLVNAGLTIKGVREPFEPQLAESAPSVENGLWRLLPDGRMETTWKLRPNARWQDGTPFTAEDVIFTARVLQDEEVDFIHDTRFTAIEAIEAPDPSTITVRWKRPSIEADELFAAGLARGALPLPRHILEAPYLANKATFTQLPFWTSEFVGTGPYRVQEWVQDSHVVLAANENYVLGRPKIDQIEVRFITSAPTLVANILAGAVELPLGRGLSLDHASELQNQWREGAVLMTPASIPSQIQIQHRNPNPPVIGNLQFRRALYHALDRGELAAGLTGGFGTIAYSGLPMDHPSYREAEDAVVKYEHDPATSMRLLEGLGYSRGLDGTFQDPAGQRLAVEIRATEGENFARVLAIADQWRRAGIATEPVQIPRARASDLEYRLTFPAFESGGNYGNIRNLRDIRTAELATPENGYRGRNDGGYATPELDTLIDRFYVTLPLRERVDTLRSIFRHLTDQVVVMYLFRGANATIIASRIINVVPEYFGNVHDWDAR
jgi:peptide/nickel transport system substrate-binding protein